MDLRLISFSSKGARRASTILSMPVSVSMTAMEMENSSSSYAAPLKLVWRMIAASLMGMQ